MISFQLFSFSPRAILIGLFSALVWLGASGCASREVNPEDPESLFQDAEQAFKDENYLIALERYRDIKNRFPYSNRAVDSELRIADTLFAQESYIEAETAYEIFRELHPTHPKSDYVQSQIAMSFYNQIPGNTARDLTAAHRAIDAFNTLLQRFPNSSYAPKAKELILEARKRLAEHENRVADFYFQRRHFLSASYRYSALLQEYPDLGYDEEALFRLGKSYFNIKMYGNAKDALRRLMAKYPASGFKSEAQSLLNELNENN